MSCNNEEQLFDGTDNSLTSFSITSHNITYNASISGDKITLSVPKGVDLSAGEVKYELCEHASIIPDPTTINNWNSQHVFRIKSYSKTPREYTYTVLRTEVSQSGNIQLTTQTDVDNFAALGITVIDGNLIIGTDSKPVEDSIINLESLRSIKEVRYNITVNRSFAGNTLEGLENIEKCGGLHIGSTTSQITLPAITGVTIDLPSLKASGDIILNSSSIKSISFDRLEYASSFFVSSNSVATLKAPLLKETASSLNIVNNSSSINSTLPELSLPELEKIGGNFSIQYFSVMNTIGVNKLTYVGGDINMSLNSGTLEEIHFPELSTVMGTIIIERAPGVVKLGLPKIKHAVSFIYNKSSYGNYPLENLDLSSLEAVDNEIYIRGAALESINLPHLTTIGGDLTLWDLKTMTCVDIPSIKKIGNRFQLYNPTLLPYLDISTLEILDKLELTGCLSLKTVKSPIDIANLTLNYASNVNCVTPKFEGLQNINGKLEFLSDSKTVIFEVENIQNIGTLKFGGGDVGAVLNLYDTETIGRFELSSSNIEKLNAPKLNKVDSIKFTNITKLTTINIPFLKTVGDFYISEHNQWGSSSARMSDLNAFRGITSINSVTINYCNKLVDYSGLSGAIATIDATKWSVSNCGYNPTYQDMVEGKYVKDK